MNICTFSDRKQHRGGIKRPKSQRYPSLKGVRHFTHEPCCAFKKELLCCRTKRSIGALGSSTLIHCPRKIKVTLFIVRKTPFVCQTATCTGYCSMTMPVLLDYVTDAVNSGLQTGGSYFTMLEMAALDWLS